MFLNINKPGYIATRMIGPREYALRVTVWAVAASIIIKAAHATSCNTTVVPRSPPRLKVIARNAG
jgi:hypothetical protein